MSISLACGGCGQRYDLADEHAGKRFKCKKCGVPVDIPIPRKRPETVASEPDPFADLDDAAEDDEVGEDSDEASEAAEDEDEEEA